MSRIACTTLFLLATSLYAADFPQPYDSEPNKSIPFLSPADAAAAIRVPEGFHVGVFAAEPDVQNPIGMCWDARGRMWVAENYTYAESAKKFDLALRDRVIILHDADHDGKAESRKVFTDEVQMLTSVALGRGGVWLMAPPQLLFIPDADGDDKPDGPPVVMLDGFTVAKSNYHNFANGLKWGPDGWLYGRCGHSCPGKLGVPGTPAELRVPMDGGIWRFHPERKIVEVMCHGTTNPWGHDWDQHGELFFINVVNGHLWHMMPGAHFKESSGESDNPLVYGRLDTVADHWHFDTKGGWQQSRNLRENDVGGGHAHAGMMIYQADQWPEQYRNKLFTLNLHGRRGNVERIERRGAGYVGRHEPDFFISRDGWFRGIEITTGPDGSGYVLDWADVGECHEHNGVHRTSGRIYKITYGTPRPGPAPTPRPPTPTLYPRCMMGEGKLPQLWKDYQAGKTTPQQLRELLSDPDEHVRVWAIRLLTDFWPLDSYFGPRKDASYPDDPESRAAFVRMAKEDLSGLVHLVLASVIHRLPVEHRAELATALVQHEKYASDHDLPALMWYGLIPLAQKDPAALVKLADACRWPLTMRWMARNLAARIEKDPQPLNALLARVPAWGEDRQAVADAVLQGMSEAFKGWRKAPKPEGWAAFAESAVAKRQPDAVRELSGLFGDGRAMDQIRKIALDNGQDLPARQAALQSLIDARSPDLRAVCESLLEVRTLNTTAVRGLALFDDPAIGNQLARSYRKFYPQERGAVLDALVSRTSFARALLENVGPGNQQIPAADISAVHARQIRSLGDAALAAKLTEVWGDLRETEADKKRLIAETKAKLTPEALAKADLSQGRRVYAQVCGSCHIMYGEGGKVGPDLTGSGRANLDYVLENILDPSAVVSADYRMTVLALKDDRVLNGIVIREDPRTLTLREATQETIIEQAEVKVRKPSPVSMMPEGLVQTLSEAQVRDLVAYLMHPSQVPLPAEPPAGR